MSFKFKKKMILSFKNELYFYEEILIISPEYNSSA